MVWATYVISHKHTLVVSGGPIYLPIWELHVPRLFVFHVCTTVEDIRWSAWCCFLCKWSSSPGPCCRRRWRMWHSCPSALHWLPVSAHHAAGWASEGQPNDTHYITFLLCSMSVLHVNITKRSLQYMLGKDMSYLYPWHLVFAHPGIDITRLIQPCQRRLPVIWTHMFKCGYNPSRCG